MEYQPLPVRVQCPHCSSLCQLDEQYLGAPVKCGKCGQPFAARTASTQPARVPQAPPRLPPVPDPPPPGKSSGLGSMLRGMFRSFSSGKPEGPIPPEEEGEEALLELDAPGAEARLAPGSTQPAGGDSVPGVCRLDVGSATSPGRVRSRNEDSFLVQQLNWSNLDRRHELALLVVADGLGGHEAGDRASGLLIQHLSAALAGLLGQAVAGTAAEAPEALLADLLKEANRIILQKAQGDPACKGMGATVAAVLIWDGKVRIGHIGDCRVYHFAGGKLTQVTVDQTLVARMVELGQLTPQEALTHPRRNEVSQAVGQHAEIAPASHQLRLSAGEWLIVACDGLHAHVEGPTIELEIDASPSSAAHVANRLVELANQGGGTDNCTVVAVRGH